MGKQMFKVPRENPTSILLYLVSMFPSKNANAPDLFRLISS